MLTVGLTGGVGAGKSTVARLLAARGAAVRDADQVVEELYGAGGAGAKAVGRLFGPRVLTASGAVNRPALARLVLAEPQARKKLEAAVHPLVLQKLQQWLEGCAGQGVGVAVVEAALLVETGTFRKFSRLVVVAAPPELRLARAVATGLGVVQVEQLQGAQAGEEERRKLADYVVENTGSLEELEELVGNLWRFLLEDAAFQARGAPLPPRRLTLSPRSFSAMA